MERLFINVIAVGAGSALGGILRYLVGRFLSVTVTATLFPWATFAVNILGCLLIGVIYGFIDRGCNVTETWRLLLTVGLCGGFTTFSTFMNENFTLFNSSHVLLMCVYTAASLLIGFVLLLAGFNLARM